jgi:hypothetical protein
MWLYWTLQFGCFSAVQEPTPNARQAEMQDHYLDGLSALDAVRNGDLEGARQAGAALARQDPVPSLPASARGLLQPLRLRAKDLEHAPSIQVAAQVTAGLTKQCHACHGALDLSVPVGFNIDPDHQAWTALVWQDDQLWRTATGAVQGTGETWDDRRIWLGAHLVDTP